MCGHGGGIWARGAGILWRRCEGVQIRFGGPGGAIRTRTVVCACGRRTPDQARASRPPHAQPAKRRHACCPTLATAAHDRPPVRHRVRPLHPCNFLARARPARAAAPRARCCFALFRPRPPALVPSPARFVSGCTADCIITPGSTSTFRAKSHIYPVCHEHERARPAR